MKLRKKVFTYFDFYNNNIFNMFSMDSFSTTINHNAVTDEDFEILRRILNKDLREQEYITLP